MPHPNSASVSHMPVYPILHSSYFCRQMMPEAQSNNNKMMPEANIHKDVMMLEAHTNDKILLANHW